MHEAFRQSSELCVKDESMEARPSRPAPRPYRLCARNATLKKKKKKLASKQNRLTIRAQELCESRGGRPGSRP